MVSRFSGLSFCVNSPNLGPPVAELWMLTLLPARLKRCVIDSYRRRTGKRAYRWPHKKNPPPPGAPTLAAATPQQTHAAAALRQRSTVR